MRLSDFITSIMVCSVGLMIWSLVLFNYEVMLFLEEKYQGDDTAVLMSLVYLLVDFLDGIGFNTRIELIRASWKDFVGI